MPISLLIVESKSHTSDTAAKYNYAVQSQNDLITPR